MISSILLVSCHLTDKYLVFLFSLETTLRNFSCLTTGDSIMVAYNNKKYYIDIVETKPSHAISIIETDCEVDFAPPLDYKEPEKPVVPVPLNKAPAQGIFFFFSHHVLLASVIFMVLYFLYPVGNTPSEKKSLFLPCVLCWETGDKVGLWFCPVSGLILKRNALVLLIHEYAIVLSDEYSVRNVCELYPDNSLGRSPNPNMH